MASSYAAAPRNTLAKWTNEHVIDSVSVNHNSRHETSRFLGGLSISVPLSQAEFLEHINGSGNFPSVQGFPTPATTTPATSSQDQKVTAVLSIGDPKVPPRNSVSQDTNVGQDEDEEKNNIETAEVMAFAHDPVSNTTTIPPPHFKAEVILVLQHHFITYIEFELTSRWNDAITGQEFSAKSIFRGIRPHMLGEPAVANLRRETAASGTFDLNIDQYKFANDNSEAFGVIHFTNAFCAENLVSDVNHGPFQSKIDQFVRLLALNKPYSIRFIVANPRFMRAFDSWKQSLSLTDQQQFGPARRPVMEFPNIAKYYSNGVVNTQQGFIDEHVVSKSLVANYKATEKVRTRFSSLTANELFTMVAVGLQMEKMVEKTQSSKQLTVAAKFLAFPGADKRYAYGVVFEEHDLLHPSTAPATAHDTTISIMDDADQDNAGEAEVLSTRFTEGDHLRMYPTPDCENHEILSGTVVAPFSCAKPGQTSAIFFLPKTLEEDRADPKVCEFQTLPDVFADCVLETSNPATMNISQAFNTMPAASVILEKVVSEQTTQKLITGVNEAFVAYQKADSYIRQLVTDIMGNAPAFAPTKSIREFLSKELSTTETEISRCATIVAQHSGLTPEQTTALHKLLDDAPSNLRLINAPGGVGKTFLLRAFFKLVMVFNLVDESAKFKVLTVTSCNALVDTTAQYIEADMTALSALVPAALPLTIIRQHTSKTEKVIASLDARSLRSQNAPAKPGESRNYQPSAQASAFALAQELENVFVDRTKQTFAGVKDKRVKKLAWTLGERLAVLTGTKLSAAGHFIHGPLDIHGFQQETCFKDFQDLLSHEIMKNNFDNLAKFSLAVNDCLKLILERDVDIVVTTVFEATTDNVASFGAHFLVIDESSRLTKAQLLAMVSKNRPRFVIMLGDMYQLGPFSNLDPQQFTFGPIYQVSAFTSLLMAGFPSIELTEQIRMSPDLTDLCVKLGYHGMKITNPSAAKQAEWKAGRKLMHRLGLGIQGDHNLVLLEVVKANAEVVSSSKSVLNIAHANTGLVIVLNLIKNGISPKDIAIVSGYRAQNIVYSAGLKVLAMILAEDHPEAASQIKAGALAIVTIDSFQGVDVHHLVLDTVVSKVPGHMADKKRVLTMVTRSKTNAYILMGTSALQKWGREKNAKSWQSSALRKMIHYCKENRKLFHLKLEDVENTVIKQHLEDGPSLLDAKEMGGLVFSDGARLNQDAIVANDDVSVDIQADLFTGPQIATEASGWDDDEGVQPAEEQFGEANGWNDDEAAQPVQGQSWEDNDEPEMPEVIITDSQSDVGEDTPATGDAESLEALQVDDENQRPAYSPATSAQPAQEIAAVQENVEDEPPAYTLADVLPYDADTTQVNVLPTTVNDASEEGFNQAADTTQVNVLPTTVDNAGEEQWDQVAWDRGSEHDTDSSDSPFAPAIPEPHTSIYESSHGYW